MNQQLAEYNKFSPKDYLTWDERSMRDLLIRQLSKSGAFTDQIHPGSDLSVLIDITAYSFAMMTYIANHNASEAVFADAQFYENVNRLCKMLGYKPKGFSTAYAEFNVIINEENYVARFGTTTSSIVRSIPRYSSIKSGSKVYSIASGASGEGYGNYQSYAFTVDTLAGSPTVVVEDNPIFLNGIWKLYGSQPISIGAAMETITLDDIQGVVAYPFVDVYVYDPIEELYERWTPVSDLYTSTPTDKVYSLRINEYKKYELQFGDGINGMKIGEGRVLYVIYLESQGDEGTIDSNEVDGSQILETAVEGMTADELLTVCYGGRKSFGTSYPMFSIAGSSIYTELIGVTNLASSVDPVDFETIESIRTNAPNSFKSGNRLVTRSDYESFVLSNYSSQIADCRAMNNFSYCAEFQNYILEHWKDENGDDLPGNPMIRIRQYNYRYSDACDHNNVYLWLRSSSGNNTSEFIKRAILNDSYKIKCVTAEIIPMDALACVFTPHAGGSFSATNWDPGKTNSFVIVKDTNSLVSNDRVKGNVVSAIINFFSVQSQKIGGIVDIAKLYSEILSMDGVKDVYTVYASGGTEISKVDGLSFSYWTPLIIRGVDRTNITNSPVKMRNFQYAKLRDEASFEQLVSVRSNSTYVTSPEF